jgi:hypothetical protein
MQERLMDDPAIRQAADAFRERLLEDPEVRNLMEELMKRLGPEGLGGLEGPEGPM